MDEDILKNDDTSFVSSSNLHSRNFLKETNNESQEETE